MRLLLQDERVDPTARDSEAIRMVIQNGHDDVIQLLQQDERVRIGLENERADLSVQEEEEAAD